ncbi:MAG: NTP transferase domain-containing protein [Candidatus Altiarchaeota archaeon]|nr:NTP transferase domain-containing protein [Candidatus Altiarchaeota archaeon]
MKGIILAGGAGSRLAPLTDVTNKHLLPVYDKPMIFYPIQTLLNAGIKEIMIVTGGENVGDFLKLLGSGKRFNARFTYGYQDGSGGIPVALHITKDFIGSDEKFVVILGDNVMEDSIGAYVEKFGKSDKGAHLLLQRVQDPERFGLAEVEGKKVVKAIEKPENPTTNLAILGVYFFDRKVFDIIPKLKASARDELEIVDVINDYVKNGDIGYDIVGGFWVDAGTFESLFKANQFIAKVRNANSRF